MQQNRITVITAISNASIRENGIGDIEMIKGVLLAWLLCRLKGSSMVKQSSTGPSALSASIGEKRGKKQINTQQQK
jgi:hypothetical protein